MSLLRPSLPDADAKTPCMTNGTAYLMIYRAVLAQPGLVHGRLHAHGEHCAIGSYFNINQHTALPATLIDEVAAVNDSVPNMSNRQRRLHVSRWLRWKLTQLGMPGFSQKTAQSRGERSGTRSNANRPGESPNGNSLV